MTLPPPPQTRPVKKKDQQPQQPQQQPQQQQQQPGANLTIVNPDIQVEAAEGDSVKLTLRLSREAAFTLMKSLVDFFQGATTTTSTTSSWEEAGDAASSSGRQ